MVYFDRPTVTRTYTEVLTDLDEKIDAATGLLSSDVTEYNSEGGTYPKRAVRWNATAHKFQRRNSANNDWENLDSTYAFTAVTTTGDIGASGNISGIDITATDELIAARVTVTGTTAPANGLYLPATNEVRYTTNGADRLTIDANGQVGIGQINPAVKFEVAGNVRFQNGSNDVFLEIGAGGSGNHASYIDLVGDATYPDYGLRIRRNNAGANASSEIIHRGTGEFIFETSEVADIVFQTQDTTRLCIDSGGSIAVGNFTDPADHLHIKNSIDGGVALRIENNDGYARIITDTNSIFTDADTHSIRPRDGSSEFARFNSSGLGIGTSTVSHKLTVNGTAKITGILTCDSTIVGTINKSDQILVTQNNTNANYQIPFSTAVMGGETAQKSLYMHPTDSSFTYNPSTDTLTVGTVVSALTGTASNAAKLNNRDENSSGNRFDVTTYVANNGVMDIGKYIDFHVADTTTSASCRLECEANLLKISGHFLPQANNTWDLGSSSYRWRNIYMHDLHLSNEGTQNEIDGTWGNYTIQEGENDLYLLNRRNGKAYKFNLTEIN
jgi:hypothetical protein